MPVRVLLQTFGCRANQYDSERVAAMITAGGGVIVDAAADADVAVFNSCAVTSPAEADLRRQVRRAAREQPALRSIVMGCAAARSPTTIGALPAVVDVIAGADLAAIGTAIGLPADAIGSAATGQRGTRGLLRIQDGCDEHCTFCATTLARGGNRSRALDALVAEASTLAAHHPEIVLTGIHIGTYGHDIGTTLSALLEALVLRVPDVRFRLSSVEATEVDAQLAALLTGDALRVAPYLHAPLQSGSDGVLRRMGRHWYTASSYASAIERLVMQCGVFGLGADIIAGFPGETDADHEATCRLVRDLPFTSLHVFPYSERPGTAAVRLTDDVPEAVRRARAAELRALGASKAAAHVAARAGGTADVIVIGHDDGHRDGLTEDYLPVDLPQPVPPRGARYRAVLARSDSRRGLVAQPLA
ncbi:MAG TPA: MiaB/RimO family radical SAM methylthiotransferase [Gemmatimonadaceae bacterium]|nr:MiaB/RimO family radical SAM methylthiotransferase [Gemmatimonadaceae bacterium]